MTHTLRMYNVHVALLSDMKMAFLIVPFSLNLVQRNKNQRVGIFNSRKVYGFTDLFGGYILGCHLSSSRSHNNTEKHKELQFNHQNMDVRHLLSMTGPDHSCVKLAPRTASRWERRCTA